MRWIYCAVLCLLPAGALAQPRTLELGEDGRWREIAAPTTAPAPDPELDRAEDLLRQRQPSAARKLLVKWLEAHPDAPLRDRAVYLLGEANYRRGDRIRAFHNFEELQDLYGYSSYYYTALQRQYEIADAYLSGYKDRLVGLAIVGRDDEAIEMLFRIQQRSPGSPLAEKALLRTADYYYDDRQFDLAADAYGAYERTYPRSPNLVRAKLRRAYAVLHQFRGIRFDATPLIDARQQLVEIRAAHPEVAQRENLTALIEELDQKMADKMLETAAWFGRTHRPVAQAYYYHYVLGNYPGTAQSERAAEQLRRLPPSARQAAATQPTSRPAIP